MNFTAEGLEVPGVDSRAKGLPLKLNMLLPTITKVILFNPLIEKNLNDSLY